MESGMFPETIIKISWRTIRGLGIGIWLSALLLGIQARSIPLPAASDELWMGVYINGIKVGYSLTRDMVETRAGEKVLLSYSESRIWISRLGSQPIELVTVQESRLDAESRPLDLLLRTKMSETETQIKAEVDADTVRFYLGDRLIKEISAKNEFYLDVPVEQIIQEHGLQAGDRYTFSILDPIAYSLSDCRFMIRGQEDLLILGEKKRLWHATTELDSLIPMVLEQWMDAQGRLYKLVTHAGFMSTVALRMPQERALEPSSDYFDIAFSSLIPSNILLKEPRTIQRMRVKLSGLSLDTLKSLPWDQKRQMWLETLEEGVLVETVSRTFQSQDSPLLPMELAHENKSLSSTVFCQSDDKDIERTARLIVGEERAAWQAAQKIAEWVDRELTANYDVGFASAREVLENRQGDCSEHTVLFVALCRAAGIPARALVGVMYAEGIFAYHMWPEVFVGEWVALDPKWLARDPRTKEYYTDATHIAFGTSDLDENMFREMITSISDIIGKLKIEVISYSTNEPPNF